VLLAPDAEAFLARARVAMKKCQVGTTNLQHAHDILAECYGVIGRLINMAEGVPMDPWRPGPFDVGTPREPD
jgi:hypothetical protein